MPTFPMIPQTALQQAELGPPAGALQSCGWLGWWLAQLKAD
jgi:hypothetical protein